MISWGWKPITSFRNSLPRTLQKLQALISMILSLAVGWMRQLIEDWSYAYNEQWRKFLAQTRTREEILNFARDLAKEYKFDVNFGSP